MNRRALLRWMASMPALLPLHRVQFRLFRHATARGHELFALARKPSNSR